MTAGKVRKREPKPRVDRVTAMVVIRLRDKVCDLERRVAILEDHRISEVLWPREETRFGPLTQDKLSRDHALPKPLRRRRTEPKP